MNDMDDGQGRTEGASRALESEPETQGELSASRREDGIASGMRMLVVDDEETARTLCAEVGREAGLEIYTAGSAERALELMAEYPADIVITDLKLPGNGGLALLSKLRESFPKTSVVVLTQFGSIETAIEATRLGAEDYLTKPFHVEDLRNKLKRIVREQELDEENRVLREQLRARPGFGGLVGVSGKMQRVYKLIEKVSQHNYPVLVLGESGTGKELVARAIHYMGNRRQQPFVPVDCSALVPTLIEAELFGYVKGAFTGATQSKQGLMESANSGTLFLDEIGDLPVDLQANCCAHCRRRRLSRWAPRSASPLLPASSRPPIATSKRLCAPGNSGRTCTSG